MSSNNEPKKIHANPLVRTMVKQLANDLGVPESQVWNFFAAEGLLKVRGEESNIWNRTIDSESNRYRHNLNYDDLLKKLRGED